MYQMLETPVTSGMLYTSFTFTNVGYNGDYNGNNASADNGFWGLNIGGDDFTFKYDNSRLASYKGEFLYYYADPTNNFQVQAPPLTINVTYTIITAYDLATGDGRMWLNPTSEASPSYFSAGAPVASIDSFGFRNDRFASIKQIDNVRIGTTFADVVPEPATAPLLILGAGILLAVRHKARALLGRS